MRRTGVTLLSAAAMWAAALGTPLIVSGCANHDQTGEAQLTLVQPAPPAPAADPGPLPAPQALADLMNRIADPAVPGAAKLPLVQNSSPPDAAAFDRFAGALRSTGFAPITVTATDLRWSPEPPGSVLATIKITAPEPGREFAFPMEFARNGDGWQLTRETAAMLLAFGNARNETPPSPVSSPPG